MKQANPAVQDLARQLLVQEFRAKDQEESAAHSAVRAFEKMRLHLLKVFGVDGFHALITRALLLATAEVSWLEAVQVKTDGVLERFSESAQEQDADMVLRGSRSLMEQLLGLLATFIGGPLTMRLVHEVWPEARVDDLDLSA